MHCRLEVKRSVATNPESVLNAHFDVALDVPFLLLPFRPSSDPSAARTFVRNFFLPPHDREPLAGSSLENELRMTEVMVGLESCDISSNSAYKVPRS